MTEEKLVAVVVGSLRRASLTRKVADALCRLAPHGLRFRFVEIRDLALYDEDREGPGLTPPAWETFRADIVAADAVLFATPEYNRSVPGGLKNALDVGLRPYGRSVWNGKPAAVVTVSPGAIGGFGANHHLRQSLVFLNMPTLQQPEAYIGHADALFSPDGSLTKEETIGFLVSIMSNFASWIDRVGQSAPPRSEGERR
ncbi:NADPH-dependent oxidoreductase [Sphingomonas koreensis]|nr:NADPH-dependent oxidoreductase [Sphingomonas koreensis]